MMKNTNSFTIILAAVLALSCTGDADRSSEPEERTDAPEYFVPHAINVDGGPEFDQNRLYLNDYSNLLHAISIIATVSRDSEYGNEAYRPDLYPDAMNDRARQWLSMVSQIDRFFNADGRITPWLEQQAGVYNASDETNLSVYPHLVYAYHIHHRSGRFEDDEVLYNRLNREATRYLATPGRYLMNEHYRDGHFHHVDGTVDHKSMSYALAGLHANAYAWVVWKKPGGQDNMGVLSKEALAHYMGHTPEQMLKIYRATAQILDESWDESRSIYDFGDGTTWHLDAIGAMIRGKKALYDFLYMFGDDDDSEASQQVFDRTASMLEAVVPLAEPWGLPEMIEFTQNGTRTASDTVNLYDWYQFLNHLGGGYGLDREREGMSMYISNTREDLFDLIGELSDNALLGALEYHLDGQSRIFTSVNYTDGSVDDDRLTVSTAGMFITMAGNLYRKGSAFDRASDWDNVPDHVTERSRRLYDAKFNLLEYLEGVL